jgi:hypothetical protein
MPSIQLQKNHQQTTAATATSSEEGATRLFIFPGFAPSDIHYGWYQKQKPAEKARVPGKGCNLWAFLIKIHYGNQYMKERRT